MAPFAAELSWGCPGRLHAPLGVRWLLRAWRAKARRGFVLLGRLRRGRASLPSLWEVETLRLEPGGMFVGRSAPRANVPKGPGGA